MPAEPPDPQLVFKAIDAYLQGAYGGEPPVPVRSALATLHAWAGKFYNCPVFSKDAHTPPNRYMIRLGNRHYPHMKLAIERSPDGQTFLFRADTHDRHCLPPEGAPEHAPFVRLMEQNQEVAQQVETVWAALNIPTFKTWLREDLARRGSTPQS